jgi:hypothetical protein
MLALSPRSATRLEETDLPEQRTRDRQLDRDDGLEVLNGHVHGRISMNDSYVRPIRTFDRPHSRNDVVVVLVMTCAGADSCEEVSEGRRIVEMTRDLVAGSGQASF